MTIAPDLPTTSTLVLDAAPAPTAPASLAPPADRHWTGAGADAAPWLATAASLVPQLAADADRLDVTGEFPHAAFARLRELGIPAMLVPAELGGGGASHATAGAVLAELAHGCPSTSLALSMHLHLVAAQVWRHHRDLPAPVLGKVADAQLILVSTGASDWIDSSGTATKVEGGYRIRGRKMPASAAPAGDIVVSSIRWEDAPEGPQVLHFAVPFAADGVSIDETWDATGMRATGSHTVVFDDVFVPDAAVSLARPAGAWHPVWSTVLGAALPLIMATYVGVAESAAERALALASRKASRPETAPLAGRMLGQLTIARDAVRAMFDASEDLRFDNDLALAASMVTRRTVAANASIATVQLALELGGGAAFARGSGLGRLLRDVHGALYHPLPEAQAERFAGRVALGLDPVS